MGWVTNPFSFACVARARNLLRNPGSTKAVVYGVVAVALDCLSALGPLGVGLYLLLQGEFLKAIGVSTILYLYVAFFLWLWPLGFLLGWYHEGFWLSLLGNGAIALILPAPRWLISRAMQGGEAAAGFEAEEPTAVNRPAGPPGVTAVGQELSLVEAPPAVQAVSAEAPAPVVLLCEEDERKRLGLCPTSWDEYVGQAETKESLRLLVEAARAQAAPLGHILLLGPSGIGKTALAYVIARELGVRLHSIAAPGLALPTDLVAFLSEVRDGEILFLDKIHGVVPAVGEVLLQAMAEHRLSSAVGHGRTSQHPAVQLPRITVIGATAGVGALSYSLLESFVTVDHLKLYAAEDLYRMLERSAAILRARITDGAGWELARRSKGNPGFANRLLLRVRDLARASGNRLIDVAVADEALRGFGVDDRGLDALDRKILATLNSKFGGGPVGIDTLAAAAGEALESTQEAFEPFLVEGGFVHWTPDGWKASPRAYDHLQLPPPASAGGLLPAP